MSFQQLDIDRIPVIKMDLYLNVKCKTIKISEDKVEEI